MTATPEIPPYSALGRTVRVAAGAIGVLFFLGAGVGYFKAAQHHEALSGLDLLLLALFALLTAASAWLGYTGLRGLTRSEEPIGPSASKSRKVLWLSIGLGFVLGLVLLSGGDLGNGLEENPVFSNRPLTGTAVAIAIAGLVAALVLSAMWHRSIDEHEQASYAFGGIIALYVYLTATLAWWLLWRGGFAVAPDSMIVLLLTTAVWLAGWLWKRSR